MMYIHQCEHPLQFYLSAIADHVDPRVKSATIPFQRPVSTGTQTYGTNPNNYPITQPMTKMTALLQVNSSCHYTLPNLHIEFVYMCFKPIIMYRPQVKLSTQQMFPSSQENVLQPLCSQPK